MARRDQLCEYRRKRDFGKAAESQDTLDDLE